MNDCDYDSLVIRDGHHHNSNLLQKLCGFEIPFPINSTGNTIYLKFITDSSVTGLGFKILYQEAKPTEDDMSSTPVPPTLPYSWPYYTDYWWPDGPMTYPPWTWAYSPWTYSNHYWTTVPPPSGSKVYKKE